MNLNPAARTPLGLETQEAACGRRRLAAQHLTIQETERRRIAVDLHDGLGQSLSLLTLGIREALRQMGDGAPPRAVESVKQLIPKVAGALDELRRVAMALRPSTLDDLGLLPTLSWFVREFEIVNPNTTIEKHIGVIETDVPEPLKLAIFRILQEAVNNAVKHAGAGCIRISLHNKDDVLAFTVEDDGKGFDPGALASRGDARSSLGMQSMRERAELSGGTCAVTSAVGHGTRVCVVWPAEQALIAHNPAFEESEIANRLFPIQCEHGNAGKTWKNVATAELDEDALKLGWNEAQRVLGRYAEAGTNGDGVETVHYAMNRFCPAAVTTRRVLAFASGSLRTGTQPVWQV